MPTLTLNCRDEAALAGTGNSLPPDLILKNSSIIFHGENNHIVSDGPVELTDSCLEFDSDNALVYLSRPAKDYQLNLHLGFGCTVFFGPDCTFMTPLGIYGAEEAGVIVGHDCMFATNVEIWNTDFHPLWDAADGRRLNQSASVYVGDHVWIGEDARILKGVSLGSGSMVGLRAVVTRSAGPNVALAGVPARVVRRNILWTRHHLRRHPLFNCAAAQRPAFVPLKKKEAPSPPASLSPADPAAPARPDTLPAALDDTAAQQRYARCDRILRAGLEPSTRAARLRNALLTD